ncbi:MAG: FtsH protease activity modulator HflK [Bacteriovoracaceae bacterium]|nr:FtsH protease activity modulator HflK [Bacteriovoracaceae bacterium]
MNQFNNQPDFSHELNKFLDEFKSKFKIFGPLSVVLLILIAGFTSYYTVGPDEEAVAIRLGKYIGTYPPGLHFKIPFGVDKVIKVKTTVIHTLEFGFRPAGTARYPINYDNESLMLTGDLNVADVEWVVFYKISDAFKFLFKTSTPVRNIRDISESIMRRVVGDRYVAEVLTTGRSEIAHRAKVLMQEVLDKYDMGILVDAVKLQNVNPPDAVKPSFNEVNEAKQEQEKVINQAEESYNKVIPEAKGKAEKLIAEATAHGKALINRSHGDADKFLSVLKEYEKAPAVTKKRIYIETMEEIYSKFENVTIVDPQVKGLLPIFQNNKVLTQ